jgi:hypothetical protein
MKIITTTVLSFLILSFLAKMWIEGIGDVPLIAGTFLRIPRLRQS